VRFVLSGGGTAGHIYPALSVAERLSAGGRDEVLFVGTPQGLEARLVPEAGVAFTGLPASGFDRSRPWTLITSSVRIALSTVRAYRLLGRLSPDAIVGFGGYVSIPVGVAARMQRVPLVLHEQNAVPGLANRVLSRWADSVATTYASSVDRFRHPERVIVTGNPVRPAVLTSEVSRGREVMGLAQDSVVVLVFGGSRGARHLNEAVMRVAADVLGITGVEVVHVAGRAEVEGVRAEVESKALDQKRWHVYEYLEDMGSALAASDLIVARAGATSIAEITVLGRPAILVPYPYATDDHQTLNAAAMAAAGAAVVVADDELDGSRFDDALLSLLSDAERRANMAAASKALGRPGAAEDVADLTRRVARERSRRHRTSESHRTQESGRS
jgi:UDP-N-acetylglucosamine--N-acetylmuramyl-(pentapeptide) pyrophosphoryl-undecaprenol N-acetylglucosamine transferase